MSPFFKGGFKRDRLFKDKLLIWPLWYAFFSPPFLYRINRLKEKGSGEISFFLWSQHIGIFQVL
jgi:hypothetical protein